MTSTPTRHLLHRLAPVLAATAFLGGCGDAAQQPPASPTLPVPATSAKTSAAALHMRIDGVEWNAEHDVFGAVHPSGYDRSILIAGSRGGKNANEQAFNLNLFGVEAPGRFRVTSTDPRTGVAQFANLGADRYLAGNVFGYDLDVEVLRFSKDPDRIEARFTGTLDANDGTKVALRDGRFVYDEAEARAR